MLRVLSTSYVASAPPAEQSRIEAAVRTLVADFPDTFELPYAALLDKWDFREPLALQKR